MLQELLQSDYSLISDQANSFCLRLWIDRKLRFIHGKTFMLGSSVAEQVAVNHLVAGSNPARAATSLVICDPAPATFPVFGARFVD